MKEPIEIIFDNISEIRMGSPYNSCNIKFNGASNIKLPKAEWQDKYGWSPDYTKLVLVKWDFLSNKAGFIFCIIELSTGEQHESPKFEGLLNNLSIDYTKIYFNKFLYNKEKSLTGALCCNIDDEYIYSSLT